MTAARTTHQPAHLLVVDDHSSARTSMADILRCAGHRVDCCASAHEALARMEKDDYDVVLTDLNMPGMTGLEFIKALYDQGADAQIVMVTAHASIHSAVEAMRYGAFDYIEKPLKADQLENVVARALDQAASLDCRTKVRPGESVAGSAAMIGSSEAMRKLQERIALVAPTNETVLISGENGTGKELVARSLHAHSRRAQREMISLNCPALSAHLLESELFGHVQGAFTGAAGPRVGRFELADGATMLLDEITEIDVPLQAKLLRVLQEKTLERVGSSESHRVDVRVIATTNRDLRVEVAEQRFREDLYFRLAVVELQVPPLRNRCEDIPELIEHFQTRAAARLGGEPAELDTGAGELLAEYHWPGNVRELENIITRASVFAGGKQISADDLRPWLIGGCQGEGDENTLPVGVSLEEMERRLIEGTLEHFDGHRQKTADALGIGVRTLSGKLRSYGLAPRAKTFSKAA